MIVSLSSLVSVLNNAMLLKSGYKLEQIFIVKSFHRSRGQNRKNDSETWISAFCLWDSIESRAW